MTYSTQANGTCLLLWLMVRAQDEDASERVRKLTAKILKHKKKAL